MVDRFADKHWVTYVKIPVKIFIKLEIITIHYQQLTTYL